MNRREVQEAIAVGLLTGADLDDRTERHVATCPGCAAEQASLRQVVSVMGTVDAADVARGQVTVANEPHLRRILAAASVERARQRRRTRIRAGLVAAAALVLVVLGLGAGHAVLGTDRVITATASAAGLSATADIAPAGDGSRLRLAVHGVPPGTDCVLQVRTADGRTQTIAEWRAGYLGTAQVASTADAPPDTITSVTVTRSDGSVLLVVPVRS